MVFLGIIDTVVLNYIVCGERANIASLSVIQALKIPEPVAESVSKRSRQPELLGKLLFQHFFFVFNLSMWAQWALGRGRCNGAPE